MTDFEKYASSAEHAEEIKKTRVGGLGGSDASLVYRVGMNGLSALTATDNKRLAVMLGMIEPNDFGGNVYTRAGHKFEDWYEGEFLTAKGEDAYKREFVMEQPFAQSFKVFAHADFAEGNFMQPDIQECKFVTTKTTEEVEKTYQAQFQWYYMLGANSVHLEHGTGNVGDEDGNGFAVDNVCEKYIERDDDFVRTLLAGIKTLDEAIADGWKPLLTDKMAFEELPDIVRDAIAELDALKSEDDERKARKDKATAIVKEFVEMSGLSGIAGNDFVRSVVYTKASETRTFDSAKFLKDHPEFKDDAKYWKTATRSSSISLK